MDRLAQAVIDGILQGSVLSLAAVGFSLVFGVLGIVNLSHGLLVIAGAYLALVAGRGFGLDPLLAMPFVAAIGFALGYLYQRWIVSPAINRSSIVSSLLVTYAVALVAQNVIALVFSPDVMSVRPDYANLHTQIGGITLNLLQVIAFGAGLLLIAALSILLYRLPIGRTIRATAEEVLAARVCGVDVEQVYAVTFGIASAFAAAAGVLIGMLFPFSPSSHEHWTIYGFVVVVLGGVGSASGALVGGLLLGLISTLTTQFIGPAYPNVFVFLTLVFMLLVRPNGLLGNAFGGSR
jgi:branched-chain amino acid transport system permease protein